MPNNNAWSVVGAATAVVVVFVLTALLNFFGSGKEWPTTLQGWATILVPALCAGLLAVLTPHYSVSEARTGARLINTDRGDAPVVDKAGLMPERKV